MSLGPLAIAVREGKLALEEHPLDRDPATIERAAFVLHEWLNPGPEDVTERRALASYERRLPGVLNEAREVLEQLEAQLLEWRQVDEDAEAERRGEKPPRRSNPVEDAGPKYRMLGVSDERTDCDHCGKTNLKCTVALEDLGTGDVVWFGRDCASKALGRRGPRAKADRIEMEARHLEEQRIRETIRALSLQPQKITHVTDQRPLETARSFGKRYDLPDGRSFLDFGGILTSPKSVDKFLLPGEWHALSSTVVVGRPRARTRTNPRAEYAGYSAGPGAFSTKIRGGVMTREQRTEADEVLERLYRQLYDTMRRVYPMVPPRPPDLIIDEKARTTDRSFAFFQYDESDASRENCSVHVSPLLGLDRGHAEGVIAHELGHYVDYFVGSKTRRGEEILRQRIRDDKGYPFAAAGWPLPSSSERLADAIAESYLDRPIYYESDCLVQTTDPEVAGLRPRPRGLG